MQRRLLLWVGRQGGLALDMFAESNVHISKREETTWDSDAKIGIKLHLPNSQHATTVEHLSRVYDLDLAFLHCLCIWPAEDF